MDRADESARLLSLVTITPPASQFDPMAKTKPAHTGDWSQRLGDYYELCKPRVVMLIVFTAIIGMLLAAPGVVPIAPFVFGTLGITLMAASAAAVNQILDRRVDAHMARTNKRPIVTGHIDMPRAIAFAVLLGASGMAVLLTLVNALTAWLTLATLVGYAGIYTVYLKRATPQNIVIGGASGAAPPLLGWAAMTGEVGIDALVLFLIIFVWTPPHFWALAIERYTEYADADIPMLPVTHGVEHTRTQVLVYSVVLFVVSLLPFAVGMSGWLYLIATIGLSGWFVFHAVRLKFARRSGLGMRMFGYSIIYLMALFLALLLDHYLAWFIA